MARVVEELEEMVGNIKALATFSATVRRKTLDGQVSVEPSVQGFAALGECSCRTSGEITHTKPMSNVQWLPILPYCIARSSVNAGDRGRRPWGRRFGDA